jgi:uncharacterized protein (TIGR03089 family)
MNAKTMPAVFRERVTDDPGSPLLTYYDDSIGMRIELSATTLDNWAAKTANMLVDGLGLGVGDRVGVWLPPHWLHAAIVLGSWAAGMEVAQGACEVAFVGTELATAALALHAADTYVVGMDSLTGMSADVPAGTEDFVGEVRAYGDRFVPVSPVGPTTMAAAGQTHAELYEAAGDRAAALDLRKGDRVLIHADDRTPVTEWLLAPLLVSGSIVLVRNGDEEFTERIEAEERITRVV